MTQKHGLGRGLSSLIPQKNLTQNSKTQSLMPRKHNDSSAQNSKKIAKPQLTNEHSDKGDSIEEIPIGMLHANKEQPRTYFDEEKLSELTGSIKVHGVLQPLIAIHKGDHYELIAGERRLRASKKAGLTTVPVVIKKHDDLTDQIKLELALIENIQRHDLNAIEEAKSYKRLVDEFDLSQEEIAVRTGKSRSVIANRIRLLSLPIEIQKGLVAGQITEGHAKVILSLSNPQKQIALYKMIIDAKLTVRQAENKAMLAEHGKKRQSNQKQTLHARRLENQLTQYFDTKVRVREGANGGNITISYFSEDELKNILSRLKLV